MSTLSAFLAQNALPVGLTSYVASVRFVDEDGMAVPWEITCITSAEDEELRKSCMKRVAGARNQYTTEMDYSRYLGLLAARCTVTPNLNSTELQNSYGVLGADALLKAMLTPGEYIEYLNKVQRVNGFDITFEEDVDAAKNS